MRNRSIRPWLGVLAGCVGLCGAAAFALATPRHVAFTVLAALLAGLNVYAIVANVEAYRRQRRIERLFR